MSSPRSKEYVDRLPRGPELRCRLLVDGVEVERRGVVLRAYDRDVLAIEATDAPHLMPRIFFLAKGADWDRLTDWVIEAWEHPRIGVPSGFVPLRRIPDAVIERMRQMRGAERKLVLAELRNSGFLPPLLPLEKGFLPHQISRVEVASLSFLAPGEQPRSK